MLKYLATFVLGLSGTLAVAQSSSSQAYATIDNPNRFTGPNRFYELNGAFIAGEGPNTTIQAAITAACVDQTVHHEVIVPADFITTEVITALTGCSSVSVQDHRTLGVPSFYSYSGGAFSLQILGSSASGTVRQVQIAGTGGVLDHSNITTDSATKSDLLGVRNLTPQNSNGVLQSSQLGGLLAVLGSSACTSGCAVNADPTDTSYGNNIPFFIAMPDYLNITTVDPATRAAHTFMHNWYDMQNFKTDAYQEYYRLDTILNPPVNPPSGTITNAIDHHVYSRSEAPCYYYGYYTSSIQDGVCNHTLLTIDAISHSQEISNLMTINFQKYGMGDFNGWPNLYYTGSGGCRRASDECGVGGRIQMGNNYAYTGTISATGTTTRLYIGGSGDNIGVGRVLINKTTGTYTGTTTAAVSGTQVGVLTISETVPVSQVGVLTTTAATPQDNGGNTAVNVSFGVSSGMTVTAGQGITIYDPYVSPVNIEHSLVSAVSVGTNEFVQANATNSAIVRTSDGTVATGFAGFYASDFMPVTPGTTYTIGNLYDGGNPAFGAVWYTSAHGYLSVAIAGPYAAGQTVTAPTNAAFIRISGDSSSISTQTFTSGTQLTVPLRLQHRAGAVVCTGGLAGGYFYEDPGITSQTGQKHVANVLCSTGANTITTMFEFAGNPSPFIPGAGSSHILYPGVYVADTRNPSTKHTDGSTLGVAANGWTWNIGDAVEAPNLIEEGQQALVLSVSGSNPYGTGSILTLASPSLYGLFGSSGGRFAGIRFEGYSDFSKYINHGGAFTPYPLIDMEQPYQSLFNSSVAPENGALLDVGCNTLNGQNGYNVWSGKNGSTIAYDCGNKVLTFYSPGGLTINTNGTTNNTTLTGGLDTGERNSHIKGQITTFGNSDSNPNQVEVISPGESRLQFDYIPVFSTGNPTETFGKVSGTFDANFGHVLALYSGSSTFNTVNLMSVYGPDYVSMFNALNYVTPSNHAANDFLIGPNAKINGTTGNATFNKVSAVNTATSIQNLFSYLSPNLLTGNFVVGELGVADTLNNNITQTFRYVGSGSTSNWSTFNFGNNVNNNITLQADTHNCVNHSTNDCAFDWDVNGTTAASTFQGNGTSANTALNLKSNGTLAAAPPTNNVQLSVPNTVTSYSIELPGSAPTSGNTFLSCTATNPTVCSWVAGGSAIANVQIALPTTAIAANSCTADFTVSMPGVTPSTAFFTSWATNPKTVTGWGNSGGLVFNPWPTANTLNWNVCNQTATSITPGAISINVGAK